MVAAPCRAFTAAARWNGHAPHVTTGAASTSDSHVQPGNRAADTIASTVTGTARTTETTSRSRATCSVPSGAPLPGRELGACALYPACSTTAIRSVTATASGKLTLAVSVAKLTVAVTPVSLFSFFSTRVAHE